MSILKLANVTKSFGDADVLRGIDLEVEEGEMICLIGASGSGKSTLLRTINLLEPIDEGEIWFEGSDISLPEVPPQPIRRKIGLVFQSFNLFPAYDRSRECSASTLACFPEVAQSVDARD